MQAVLGCWFYNGWWTTKDGWTDQSAFRGDCLHFSTQHYVSSPCDLEWCYLLVLVSSGLIAAPFRGYSSVLEVLCSGEALNPDLDLLTMVLYETASHSVLATLSVASRECSTGSSFTSCTFSAGDSRRTRISTLVTDLAEGEQRDYGCNVTSFRSGDRAYFTSWITTALRLKTTTTTAATTTTSTTTSSVSASKNDGRSPIASSVHSELPGFYLPPYVLIIGLVLIVLLALLSLILIILQCRRSGRRRRRNRAANRESLLSTKSEMASCSGPKDLDLGVTTYRATRSFPSFSAAPQPQTVAGVQPGPAAAAFAMRYQKGPPDDTGYVSGSSNHYSEPYGCHDDSTQERVRPVSRTTIPQAKGSPQPPRLPDNHP
ncbi:uncharacterized protein LOC112568586 isoform X3 [Pomacea canaliculata]|uniref:uncharacterized protein LOC112568586 isoform X3 n=1 Tax=Pomacea canaliculata TaxID=400727 RepID=UPI000D72BFA3|nr:uncharacterized protein LOC112568586 isoform X3 [Pomacea canaliculata]